MAAASPITVLVPVDGCAISTSARVSTNSSDALPRRAAVVARSGTPRTRIS